LNQGVLKFYLNKKLQGIAYNNIKGPVRAAVTLYSTLDSIQLIPNPKEIPDTKKKLFEDGTKVILKSKWGDYFSYDDDYSPITTKYLKIDYSVFKTKYNSKNDTYQFIDDRDLVVCVQDSNDNNLKINVFPNQKVSGVSLKGKKSYLGTSTDGNIFYYDNDNLIETRWFIEVYNESLIEKVGEFQNNSKFLLINSENIGNFLTFYLKRNIY
jgi:hypothetical protein